MLTKRIKQELKDVEKNISEIVHENDSKVDECDKEVSKTYLTALMSREDMLKDLLKLSQEKDKKVNSYKRGLRNISKKLKGLL